MDAFKTYHLFVWKKMLFTAIFFIHLYLMAMAMRQGVADLLYRNPLMLERVNKAVKMDALEFAILADPQNPIYRHEMGLYYSKLGNQQSISKEHQEAFFELAIKNFRQSIAMNPVNSQTQLHLASSTYKRFKDQKKFANSLKRVKVLDPYNKFISQFNEAVSNANPSN